jgi:WD40 repeat protein
VATPTILDQPNHGGNMSLRNRFLSVAIVFICVCLVSAAINPQPDTFEGHSDYVGDAVASPDGKTLATFDSAIRLWDMDSRRMRLTLRPTNSVWGIAFSPDGQSISAGNSYRTIQVWDTTTGVERATFRGHTRVVWHVAFSPDSKMLASVGCDDKVNCGISRQVRKWQHFN